MDKSPTLRLREFYDLLDRHKLSGLPVTQADLDRIAAACGVEAPKLPPDEPPDPDDGRPISAGKRRW